MEGEITAVDGGGNGLLRVARPHLPVAADGNPARCPGTRMMVRDRVAESDFGNVGGTAGFRVFSIPVPDVWGRESFFVGSNTAEVNGR